jgi:hypothetical protein
MANPVAPTDRAGVGVNWHIGGIDEDVITGHVFSTLRYVPRACDAFLQALTRQNRDILGATDPFNPRGPVIFEPWPAWRVPDAKARMIAALNKLVQQEIQSLGQEPSPADVLRLKGTVIPDVVLRGPGWNLVIEAEWSYAANVPQLVEQVLLAHDNLPEARHTFVALVNRRVSPPGALRSEVERVLERIPQAGLRASEIVSRILWFNWQGIASIFAASHPDMLLQDQLAFLSRAAIQPAVDFPVDQLPGLAARAEHLRAALRSSELDAIHGAVQASRNLVGEIADVNTDLIRPRTRSARRS